MGAVNLKQMLAKARSGKYAVGAFNIFNHLSANAAVQAAEAMMSPLILQTSVSTVKFFGTAKLAKMLLTMVEDSNVPIVIHLDHCKDVVLTKECLDNGWTSVMFDGSQLPFNENLRFTQEIVEYAKRSNATVEGELGTIAGVEEDIVLRHGSEALVNVNEAQIFVKSTGIDALAPAIGTAHGVYKGTPKIAFDLFSEIVNKVECPCVVHGGTGLETMIIKKLISLGAAKINVSTAVKIAYSSGLKEGISGNSLEPIKLDKFVTENIINVIKEHILLFESNNRI